MSRPPRSCRGARTGDAAAEEWDEVDRLFRGS